MAIDGELDYDKIRNAMDKASDALYKKQEDDLEKTKKEQKVSEEKTKQEKKDNLFKWITYAGVIFIAVIIIIIIIFFIVRSFQKSSNNTNYNTNNQPTQLYKPIQQQQQIFKPPYQLFPPNQPQMPQMQPQMPQMPLMQPQMPLMQPQMPVIMPQQPQIQPQPQMQPLLNSSSQPYQINNNTDISSFNFPSTNSSFFNKLDYNTSTYQQPIKRGGRKNKN
jgi:cytoskeletal protein RodZ